MFKSYSIIVKGHNYKLGFDIFRAVGALDSSSYHHHARPVPTYEGHVSNGLPLTTGYSGSFGHGFQPMIGQLFFLAASCASYLVRLQKFRGS